MPCLKAQSYILNYVSHALKREIERNRKKETIVPCHLDSVIRGVICRAKHQAFQILILF